jgi:PAS domain S-box-containing protein
VLTDVTPYREMERELRESEEKFRLLSEQSMLGLIMVQDGNVIYTNQAFADIFEGSIEEVMAIQSYGFFKYIYPDDFAMVHDQVVKKEVGEEEVESHYSYRILTPLGKVKWVEHFSKTVRLHGRNAIFIAMADISEKKRYEEEKRKMEEQLFQLQKLHSLGNLAGEISHDFNNLLHVIRGFAELGKIQEEPESVREYFRTIQETVESGLNLTQKLLLFSRKGEGKKRKFSINRLVEDCLKMVGPLIEKGVKIEFSPGKRIPDILAVHGNLEQVLMNLVLNARDAMPSGGKIQIQTCLRKRKKKFPGGKFSGKCVCLSVKDNGTGISEENRQRIFEPFFTTKEEGEGTGLGLSVVFGIVQSHGGWIELESDLGKGACFNVYLPLLSL